MSKMSDVRYGRQGGRLVATKDGRPLLEQIAELREEMGGDLRQDRSPAPAADDSNQGSLFDA